VVEARGVIWADARGLNAEVVAHALCERLGKGARAGISEIPVVAELAARFAQDCLLITHGTEREFVSALPLRWLFETNPESRIPNPESRKPEKLLELVQGVGIETCGEFAALEREAVEVRFGPDAVRLWRRARCDDERRLFLGAPTEQ